MLYEELETGWDACRQLPKHPTPPRLSMQWVILQKALPTLPKLTHLRLAGLWWFEGLSLQLWCSQVSHCWKPERENYICFAGSGPGFVGYKILVIALYILAGQYAVTGRGGGPHLPPVPAGVCTRGSLLKNLISKRGLKSCSGSEASPRLQLFQNVCHEIVLPQNRKYCSSALRN